MRTIKFRAWDKKCKEMIYKVPINTVGQHAYLGEDAELMQYSGLHDKNGKEIYEGDILRYGKKDDGNLTYACSWSELQSGWNIGELNAETSEVIGNIYENPELLEGKLKKYKVTNTITGETKEVVANSAQEACEKLGWMIGYCRVQEVQC